jgi:hypothetical protein
MMADRRTIPLPHRSVAQLRAQAEEYRRMAASARTPGVQASLFRLAQRLDALVEQREQEQAVSADS